ncbi:M23 family metallopeptidase [Streptomyces xanthochromogenes]|uniref:Peptidase n=1 Tax=Streptomyces xanthochromogenes TaxID=67384 RepID=A0ABQ3A1N7_9ACTN|nr:M23 family metallopeptidase [Streptomyces xanthochromogenes]GGY32440.1 peptidase [Streptomyces xanthochromogenes]
MTDQHAHAGYVGHDGYLNGSSGHDGNAHQAQHTGSFAVDPLFGAMHDGYAGGSAQQAGGTGQFDTGAFASPYDSTGQWTVPAQAQAAAYEPEGTTGSFDTGAFQTAAFHAGTPHGNAFATGQFETGTFAAQGFSPRPADTGAFATGSFDTGSFDTGSFDTTGQWDAGAWNQAQGTGPYDNTAFASAFDTTGQWAVPGTHTDTGTFDATAWNATAADRTAALPQVESAPEPQLPHETAEFPQVELPGMVELAAESDAGPDGTPADMPGAAVPASRAEARRGASRRRRTPAKRSALLTVAVPSVCVMGVAGVAVASVGGMGGSKDEGSTVTAASDPASVKPVAANTKLDTQLANLSADANSFADRASRTQERIDLKARQDAEKKKKEDAAAAKEAARPKFVLPVTQKGLSAYYGQAGVNWMSVHTGIDFPVSYGTPVMSAIDGTIRTQWNSAYGNMAIVTGADGTETWYCHLSSTKLRSGPVKAGEVIAYSGNSGNSTGPHLHFEVRPHGGSSIDPLPWLRSHGLDPT